MLKLLLIHGGCYSIVLWLYFSRVLSYYFVVELFTFLVFMVNIMALLYVTGSGKRDIFAQTMIFQYKRCCSKKRNMIYY